MRPLLRIEHVRTFYALDTEGCPHRLHEYVNILDVGTRDDPMAETPGATEFRSDAGALVKFDAATNLVTP